jgi:hypothetical protein
MPAARLSGGHFSQLDAEIFSGSHDLPPFP